MVINSFGHAKEGYGHFLRRVQRRVVIILSMLIDSGHFFGRAWSLAHCQAQHLGAWLTAKPNRL